MARPSSQKRAKEKARMDRQKEKERKRAEVRDRKANAPPRIGDEDPDIAGIRPGPQPVPEWFRDEEEAEGDEEDQKP